MKRYLLIAAIICVLPVAAIAQMPPQAPYASPDETTWSQMVTALGQVPTSKEAHAQIDNILNSVQQIAQRNKTQADMQAMTAKKAADEAALKAAGSTKTPEQISTLKK